MNANKEILKAIIKVRDELKALKLLNEPKEVQIECYKRLVALYSALDVQSLVDDLEITLKAA